MIPRALWVVPVSNLAGVARHVLDVAEVGLPGWDLTVTAPEGPLLERLRTLGTPVIPARIEPGIRPDRAARELRRSIKQVKPAVVHSHLARADLLNALASVCLPVRLVSTEHHIPPDRFIFHPTLLRAKVMETIHHLRLRRFNALMAVSDSTKRDMLAYWRPTKAVTVVLNGVDRPSPAPAREAGFRYLSLARLAPEKNIELTLRAFAKIGSKEPTATLTIAGSGESGAALRRLADLLSISERTTFAGFVDADEALATHDVVLQPSKSDNCSYTLLDAVVHGLGVAASPIGGNPEILPAHCIADLDDLEDFVRIALEQGRDPSRRPTLPDAVPTRAEMASAIVEQYAKAAA